MKIVIIRHPELSDEKLFLDAMHHSEKLHYPWTKAPATSAEFQSYYQRCQSDNFKGYLVFDASKELVGVFNLSEIVRGCFQNAYLGFYGVDGYAGQGYMSAGLQLLLNTAFNELKLHRVEANVQPDNIKSLHLLRANGFQKEGYSPRYLKINDKWCDHERWAMTIEDWNMSENSYE
jgi:RimJ/RimL family protein N-acetyltransferase